MKTAPPRTPMPPRPDVRNSAVEWGRGHKVLTGVIALFLVVGLISIFGDKTDAGTATDRSAAEESPSPASTPSPTVAAEPVVQKTRVPRLVGVSLQKARRQVDASSLEVYVIRKVSHETPGTVLSQSVGAGKRIDEGTTIQVVIAKPFPRVPGLAGQNAKTARRNLESAGFRVNVQLQESSSASAGRVIYSIPAAGSEIKPGASITLVVAKAPPQTAPAPSGCHPSYTGACLDPNASDYDCAGGSGDGPKYTGFVHVVGYDEFGLDADHDGLGCES